MTFPVELRKLKDGRLTFAQDIDKERITKILEIEDLQPNKPLETIDFSSPFTLFWEDIPYGRGTSFGEKIDEEIRRRGGNSETVNAYLPINEERVVSEAKIVYGNHRPIHRPKVLEREIRLYSVPEEDAKKQRSYICGFVNAWTSK